MLAVPCPLRASAHISSAAGLKARGLPRRQVFELAKKQEETKVAEMKKQEAENQNYAKQVRSNSAALTSASALVSGRWPLHSKSTQTCGGAAGPSPIPVSKWQAPHMQQGPWAAEHLTLAAAAAEQAEMEREKIHWEEMRKTQHQQSQTKAQLARYEDELARKRMEVRAALSLSDARFVRAAGDRTADSGARVCVASRISSAWALERIIARVRQQVPRWLVPTPDGIVHLHGNAVLAAGW